MTDNYEVDYACVTTDSVVVTSVSIYTSIFDFTFRATQISFTEYHATILFLAVIDHMFPLQVKTDKTLIPQWTFPDKTVFQFWSLPVKESVKFFYGKQVPNYMMAKHVILQWYHMCVMASQTTGHVLVNSIFKIPKLRINNPLWWTLSVFRDRDLVIYVGSSRF